VGRPAKGDLGQGDRKAEGCSSGKKENVSAWVGGEGCATREDKVKASWTEDRAR